MGKPQKNNLKYRALQLCCLDAPHPVPPTASLLGCGLHRNNFTGWLGGHPGFLPVENRTLWIEQAEDWVKIFVVLNILRYYWSQLGPFRSGIMLCLCHGKSRKKKGFWLALIVFQKVGSLFGGNLQMPVS